MLASVQLPTSSLLLSHGKEDLGEVDSGTVPLLRLGFWKLVPQDGIPAAGIPQ